MAYTIPTYDDLVTFAKSLIKGKRSDAALGEGSDADILSTTLGHIGNLAHLHIDSVLRNLHPLTAEEPWIDGWAYLFGLSDGTGGYGRIKPRGSTGSGALTVIATGGGPWGDLQNETFTESATGLTFKISNSFVATAAGTYTVDVAAVSTGLATNLKSADSPSLAWSSNPAGFSSTLALTSLINLVNGCDREKTSELRARLADVLQSPGLSATPQQWRRVIESAIPGSLVAYVYPRRESAPYGYGMVDYSVTVKNESGTYRIPNDDQIDTVEAAVESNMPVRQMRNSRFVLPKNQTCSVDATIEIAPGASDQKKCDFDAESVKRTVSTNDAAGPNITCSGNICSPTVTDGLEVGDRVIINNVEGIVTSVNVGSDAKVFAVSNWPTEWGSGANSLAAKYVLSGGGVIMDCITDVKNYIDSLAPEATYASVRYLEEPALATDTLTVKWVQWLCIDADSSVIDCTVNDIAGGGAVDKSPEETDPTIGNLTINYLIPGEIRIWEDK